MIGVAVVTGASRGLGAALARALAERGVRLALCATTLPSIPCALRRVVDMVAADEVDAFVAAVHAELGRIDLWINNAGVLGPIGPVRSIDATAWRHAVDVNLNGTFNGSRAFLANASDSGVLVNIASRAGIRSAAGLGAYSATKAGVIALSTAIAEEQADTGLRTIVVIPPSIDTGMQDTLLRQEPELFPGVATSRRRRDEGGVWPVFEAAHLVLGAVLDGTDGPVIDLSAAPRS